MEGKSVEPVGGTTCEKVAAVGQQRVPAIYTHTTLTNDTRHTQHYLIGSGRERSLLSDAYLNALLTGTDATGLSGVEPARLNEIDAYLPFVTRMGACNESDVVNSIRQR